MEHAVEIPDDETNRRLRAERRRDKLMAEWRSRGLGAGAEVLDEAVARWPGQWNRQLRFVFDVMPLLQRGRDPKPVTNVARQAFYTGVVCILEDMVFWDIAIRDLSDLGQAEVMAIIPIWIWKGLKGGTIQYKLSELRRFSILIGRPEVLLVKREFQELLRRNDIDPARVTREQVRPAQWWERSRELKAAHGT